MRAITIGNAWTEPVVAGAAGPSSASREGHQHLCGDVWVIQYLYPQRAGRLDGLRKHPVILPGGLDSGSHYSRRSKPPELSGCLRGGSMRPTIVATAAPFDTWLGPTPSSEAVAA